MKKYIGTKVSYYGRRYTVTDYHEDGTLDLVDRNGNTSTTHATIKHSDLGGKKSTFALKDVNTDFIYHLISYTGALHASRVTGLELPEYAKKDYETLFN